MGRKKKVPIKVETKNFSGRDSHFSILFREVTVKTKDGKKYSGDIINCDYDKIVISPHARKYPVSYIVVDWDNVAEFINWGWCKEWRDIQEGKGILTFKVKEKKRGKRRRRGRKKSPTK